VRLVAFTVALLSAAMVFGMNSSNVHAEAQDSSKTDKVIVKVKPGDSLSKIAEEKSSTYQRIFFANETIKYPDLIYPDMELRIPTAEEELVERPLPAENATLAIPKTTNKQPVRTGTQSQIANHPIGSNFDAGIWDRIASCESGGNWSINTGNGYYGGLQFTLPSWKAVGGQGYPHQASKAEQIERAKILQSRQGWGAWPACTSKLGLR